jgi:serine/threonine-protein kinase
MLVGKYPFEANTAWEWASKHMTEPPRPIETQPLGDHVPLAMRNAISRALAKNKDERFTSVKEFYDAIAGNSAQQQQTAAMGAAAAASAGGNAAALPASEPGGRAKTEMAQPVMGGPPAGAVTPPYGPGPGGPMGTPAPQGGAAASVPQGPMHTPAKKGGGSGLVIGLAVLAVLLIGGGVTAYALRGKPKPVPTTTLADLGGAGSASAAPVESATAAPPDDSAAAAAGTTDPLGGTTTAAAVPGVKPAAGTNPTGPKTTPSSSAKPSIPTPIPKPPAADPPICANARSAAARKSPAAGSLAAQCVAAGGKL